MSIVWVHLERDLVELVLLEQHVLPVVDLVALDLVFVLDDVAGLGIDRLIADAIAGFAVDDVAGESGSTCSWRCTSPPRTRRATA